MLKFITEEHLKDLYRKEPFSTYEINSGQRLTPGGRQYLLDKGININLPIDNKEREEKIQAEVHDKNEKKHRIKSEKIRYKFKAIEALFLSYASELINKDLILAQKVIDIERSIKKIRDFIEGKCELEHINEEVCREYPKYDCVEITDVYIHLKNSREILNLYYLFYKIKEFKCEFIEEYEGENNILEKAIKALDSLINELSKTICEAIGGIQCQIKK